MTVLFLETRLTWILEINNTLMITTKAPTTVDDCKAELARLFIVGSITTVSAIVSIIKKAAIPHGRYLLNNSELIIDITSPLHFKESV